MNENYIVINGKRAELTEEQLKQLGIVTEKKNPFARVKEGDHYYIIECYGEVKRQTDIHGNARDNRFFDSGNYCTDKKIMEQRALHETLHRLLWRYSMEHKYKETPDYYTIRQNESGDWTSNMYSRRVMTFGEIAFDTREIAKSAITEIVEPFMKEHPEFVW